MKNNFKTLYVNSLSKFVGKNITRNEANELYQFIKKNASNVNEVKNISIDDNKASSHYFFASCLVKFGVAGIGVYQDKENGNIILTNVNNAQVLKVGQKVKNNFNKFVTILELGSEEKGINQEVVYKSLKGVTTKSNKWSLLGLN